MTPEQRANEKTRMEVKNILGIPHGPDFIFSEMSHAQILGMLLLDIDKKVDALGERGCSIGEANAARISALERTQSGAIAWLRGIAYFCGALVAFAGFVLVVKALLER